MKLINIKKGIIFCSLVLLLSILNIFKNQSNIITLTVGLSIIGILGVVAYFLNIIYFKYFFLIWILGQFIIIEYTVIISGLKSVEYLFNLSQYLELKIGLTFGSVKSVFVGLNIIPFGLLLLYRQMVKVINI